MPKTSTTCMTTPICHTDDENLISAALKAWRQEYMSKGVRVVGVGLEFKGFRIALESSRPLKQATWNSINDQLWHFILGFTRGAGFAKEIK